MKTLILVELEHTKPLPADITDNIANKLWTTLYNKDVRCQVDAKIWQEPQKQPAQDKRWTEVV